MVVTCLQLVLESGARPSLRRGGGGSELRGGALDDRVKDDHFSGELYSIYLKSAVRMYRSGMKVGRLRCCRRVGDKRGWKSAKPASSNRGSVARLDSSNLAVFLMQPLRCERR